jgi:hypothetical protein
MSLDLEYCVLWVRAKLYYPRFPKKRFHLYVKLIGNFRKFIKEEKCWMINVLSKMPRKFYFIQKLLIFNNETFVICQFYTKIRELLNSALYYPSLNSVPYYPSLNSVPYYPSLNSVPYYPSLNSVTYYPSLNSVPYYPSLNSVPYYPSLKSVPYYPSLNSVPYYPSLNSVPYYPSLNSVPYYPSPKKFHILHFNFIY